MGRSETGHQYFSKACGLEMSRSPFYLLVTQKIEPKKKKRAKHNTLMDFGYENEKPKSSFKMEKLKGICN